jgi:hypothetical protein
MTRFPTAGPLVSWAKYAPGVKESAGKRKGSGSTARPDVEPDDPTANAPSAVLCCSTPRPVRWPIRVGGLAGGSDAGPTLLWP